jgi:hypothetical protein
MKILKNFEIKFAYLTNDIAKTNIKNHIYHYTTPREMVICDSDGVTGMGTTLYSNDCRCVNDVNCS